MLTHSKKTSFSYLRRLLVLPISFSLLLLLSFSVNTEIKSVTGVEMPQEVLHAKIDNAKKDTIPKKYLTADGKGIKGSYLVDMHGDAAVFMDPKTKQVLFAIPVAQLLKTVPDPQYRSIPSVVIAAEEVVGEKGIQWDTAITMIKQISPSRESAKISFDGIAGSAEVVEASPNLIIGTLPDSASWIESVDVRKVDNKSVIILKGRNASNDQGSDKKQVLIGVSTPTSSNISSPKLVGDKQVVFVQRDRSIENTLPSGLKYIVDGKFFTKDDMESIDPAKIQSVNILKGENAVKRFGESASNGVVEITLKK